jgi:hypothetical protein
MTREVIYKGSWANELFDPRTTLVHTNHLPELSILHPTGAPCRILNRLAELGLKRIQSLRLEFVYWDLTELMCLWQHIPHSDKVFAPEVVYMFS